MKTAKNDGIVVGVSALRSFLDHPARPAGTLCYHELQGSLFTIASAPELVRPPEWMPIVFDDHEAARIPQRYRPTVPFARRPWPIWIHKVLMEEQGIQTKLRRTIKIGRHDPRPCGSGRKHKKCCGAVGA